LQKEWDEFGPDNFTIEILARLAYDEDESRTDYGEGLGVLRCSGRRDWLRKTWCYTKAKYELHHMA